MTKQRYNTNTEDATKRQNICLEVVKIARDDRQVKALAAFYLLKQYYRNSRIYNHRPRMGELADRLQISTQTLYTYFNYLLRLGLIHAQGDHLLLQGTAATKRTHRERKKYQITISDQETLQTVEARLYGKLLEEHARRIEFKKRIERFERRYTRRRNTFKKRCDERGPGYHLSMRNLQKLFNLGRIKATRAILLLNNLGVLHSTQSRPQRVAQAPQGAVKYTDGLPGYFFVRKGQLYMQMGNHHELLEHPPAQRELNYRQYILIYKNLQKSTQL